MIFGFFFSEGKPIPTELRNEEAALRKEIDLEDEITAGMLITLFFSMHCLYNFLNLEG